jgi:predicted metal-dependent phosphoesterase TrpH
MNPVDLHTHSTISDGSFSPEEVVKKALKAGLSAMALTDHDNIGGVETALETGKEIGILVVPGVEISAQFERGTLHILGYFFDPSNPSLQKKLNSLQQARAERNPKIAKKLQGLGIDITYEEVAAIAGSTQVGRPHFARILMNKGIVQDFNEAFDRFLGKDKAAYVDKFRYTPQEAFEMIREAGGVAVVAHPYTLNLTDDELYATLKEWLSLGLLGLEIFYPDHPKERIQRYAKLADTLGLLKTGGSDFHGNNKEGSTLGDCGPLGCPSFEIVDQLRALARS